jgi:sigma-B regulation protein RsbU (phosphoserine phosphatase)
MLAWFQEKSHRELAELVLMPVEIVALLLLPLAFLSWIAGLIGPLPVSGAVVLTFIFNRKAVMWSVRAKLLRTFIMLGVVPLLATACLVVLSWRIGTSNLTTLRFRDAVDRRLSVLSSAAQDLALTASNGRAPELMEEIRKRVPRMSAVITSPTGPLFLPDKGVLQAVPPGFGENQEGLIQANRVYYLAVRARSASVDAFVYVPLDSQELAELGQGKVDAPEALGGDAALHFGVTWGRSSIAATKDGVTRSIQPRSLPESKGWWDLVVVGTANFALSNPEAGSTGVVVPLFSRPSVLLSGAPTGALGFTLPLLFVVGTFLLWVELAALFMSARRTRAITRAVHGLYEGTQHVAQADFEYTIPVRGKDQLSELAGSFNGMTSKIRELIGELRKKEKLEAELAIARQVQERLFPRRVPELPTLELHGVCIPGRYISGDYYDFIELDDPSTAIALGDVSGKGVSAALLMASIQASMHAQLGMGRGHGSELSTSTLMALIGQQLYESTPSEKYATFFCSVYDDATGILRYTNAGHLQPILVRAGTTSALEGGGMVIGLLPNVQYDQYQIQLQPGDLVAIFSDGIPEAENASAHEYGETRLAGLLRQNANRPLDELSNIITKSVDAWAHDPAARDDTTLVLMRCREA